MVGALTQAKEDAPFDEQHSRWKTPNRLDDFLRICLIRWPPMIFCANQTTITKTAITKTAIARLIRPARTGNMWPHSQQLTFQNHQNKQFNFLSGRRKLSKKLSHKRVKIKLELPEKNGPKNGARFASKTSKANQKSGLSKEAKIKLQNDTHSFGRSKALWNWIKTNRQKSLCAKGECSFAEW